MCDYQMTQIRRMREKREEACLVFLCAQELSESESTCHFVCCVAAFASCCANLSVCLGSFVLCGFVWAACVCVHLSVHADVCTRISVCCVGNERCFSA